MGALSDAKPLLLIAAGELHLHPAVLTFVILAVAVLITRRIIRSLDFLVARRRAAGEPRLLLHPTGTVEAAAAPAGSAPRSPLADFVVLCLAMATVLHAEPLVHTAELRLGPAIVVFGVLAAAALFDWVIVSINHIVASRPAKREPKMPPRPRPLLQHHRTAPATSAVRPSSLPRSAFVVLAALMSASWFVEPLAAAAKLRLGPAAVVCGGLTAAALFNWVLFVSINHFVAPRPAQHEPKTLLLLLLRRTTPDASTTMVRPFSLARLAFVVLAALTSASWFVEPFAAAADLRLPRVAVIITVALFAALFNFSVHSFRSFFLTRRPVAAAQWEVAGAIAVAVMSVGVAAACLVAAAGSAYVYAPARS